MNLHVFADVNAVLENDMGVKAAARSDSAIGRAIERRGEGVHTVALSVDDLEKTVRDIVASGAPVIREEGMDNTAFVHPKSTHGVLLQVDQEKS